MRKVLFAVVIIFCFLKIAQAQKVVRFSPLPVKPKEELIASYLPLVNLLEQRLGVKLEIVYIPTYEKLIESFRQERVDLAVLGPVPYYLLERQYPYAYPVVYIKEPDGRASYTCVLLTLRSGPKSLRELKGPVATPQRLSTCGYFSLSIVLSKEKRHAGKLGYRPFENHREAFEAVLRGEYEAVILKKSIAESYMRGFPVKVLAESPEWPAFLLVANSRTLSQSFINTLRDTLLSLSGEELKRLAEGRYGFAPAQKKDFEIIKINEAHIPD